jgi:tRNA-intron endonuclease
MQVTFDGSRVHAGTDARERFYDSRGYGQPRDGNLELAPVEAAHLLFRGDIETVHDDRTGEALDFQALLASQAVPEVDFFVYKDLRNRGFYLSPAREDDAGADFVVYPRGQGPWDDDLAYRIQVKSERAAVTATTLCSLASGTGATDGDGDSEATGVLAVVDEESEVTYLSVDRRPPSGSTAHDLPTVAGDLLADRVLVDDPPAALHQQAFYGQPLDSEDDPVQLSLVEAAHLAREGALSLSGTSGVERIVERGREVEGERFDRRLRAYAALRTAGVVPKTGFKFGADFRTYADVESVDDLGHSELLVRVLPSEHTFDPRDLALDVRLAHGVRKTMVYALADRDGVAAWLAVERLTP